MRIARYTHAGTESWGLVTERGIVDRAELGDVPHDVRSLIASGRRLESPATAAVLAAEDVELLPPVELHKVVCAGVNFHTHRAEARLDTDRPAHPTIFTRFPDAHVGHDVDIVKSDQVERFDYEGELAVVIGRRADRVAVEDALNHVYGYACFDDGSARDWQKHAMQWAPGKNFVRSGSMGPHLVTADEVPAIGDSWLETRVNGEVRQRAQIVDMVFSIAELIAYISAFTPLEPGDVIAAGTPGGVGLFMDPPTFLQPGDVVEVEIDGVGLLRNRIGRG